jgi:hypothetical protein
MIDMSIIKDVLFEKKSVVVTNRTSIDCKVNIESGYIELRPEPIVVNFMDIDSIELKSNGIIKITFTDSRVLGLIVE